MIYLIITVVLFPLFDRLPLIDDSTKVSDEKTEEVINKEEAR